MDVNQYLEWREMEETPLPLFFEYYKDRGGTFPIDIFEKAFLTFIAQAEGQILFTNKGIKQFSLKNILENIYYYYNNKFAEFL